MFKPYGIWGLDEAKKSISFPIVNGTDNDTDEETRSNPTAISNGFRSGFARLMILRNEDLPVSESSERREAGKKREREKDFGCLGASSGVFLGGFELSEGGWGLEEEGSVDKALV